MKSCGVNEATKQQCTFLWYCFIMLLPCKQWEDRRASEQNFPVVLFVMLYKVVLLSLWMKSYGVTIQMKATEQYFPLVLFIMLYKVVLTFESVDKIL